MTDAEMVKASTTPNLMLTVVEATLVLRDLVSAIERSDPSGAVAICEELATRNDMVGFSDADREVLKLTASLWQKLVDFLDTHEKQRPQVKEHLMNTPFGARLVGTDGFDPNNYTFDKVEIKNPETPYGNVFDAGAGFSTVNWYWSTERERWCFRDECAGTAPAS